MKLKPQHLRIGQLGEDAVVKHLVKLGFKIVIRNYRKKWGEIDIIARSKILHFIEVKTVSHETAFDNYQPEENMTFSKRKRLERAIRTYLASVSHETEFQVDVAAVYLNPNTGENKIRMLENIIL